MEFDSPGPAFSMKGRTVQSMLRLMRDWHRSLGGGSAGLLVGAFTIRTVGLRRAKAGWFRKAETLANDGTNQ